MILQISASAGSGKTYTLTRHFLQLLNAADITPSPAGCAVDGRLHGYSLQEILAATFTNRAAAEMRDRVLGALKQAALDENAETAEAATAGDAHGLSRGAGTAGRWVESILRHYGSLNIRTIDSLLATLVRLSALELDLPPDFRISFDPREYYTPAYEALMDDLARSAPHFWEPTSTNGSEPPPGLASPHFAGDAASLRAGLAEACRSQLYLTEFRGFSPKNRLHDLVLELVARLLKGEATPLTDTGLVHARLNALHADMVRACRTMRQVIENESLKANRLFCAYLDNCASANAFANPPESVFRLKTSLDDCLNAGSRGKAPDAAHAAFDEAQDAVRAYSQALPLCKQALQLAPLALLAAEIHARLESERRDNGLLPALCLPVLAGEVLSGERGVSDALCRLGSRLSRMLLDEFQDTSREQWAAIQPLAAESLATGGSLTYVGDVKQAIYGWRGGDARLFDEAAHDPELRAIAPEAEFRALGENWRSHPAVVQVNNALFSLLGREDVASPVLTAMLPEHTPDEFKVLAAREAVRNYSGVRQGIPSQKDWSGDPNNQQAKVRLYAVDGVTVDDVREMVRLRLERLFRDELLRDWSFGDIAVLVRSGDEGATVARWLTDWGIPVVTENSFLLSAHPLVGRLISFLTFLDYPMDDAAFLEFLQSEFLEGYRDVPDRDRLHDWLAARTRELGRGRPPLHLLFRRDFPALWAALIEPFHSQAGLMSAYDTLLEAVRRFELLERLPDQAPFLRRLLELAHLAETRGHSSLAAFLAFWRECEKDEKLPLPEHMDAVRILTIHKAKGLEFPVVVLPFQHKGRRREPSTVAVRWQGIDMLTRAAPELADLYYPACVTDELERLNLLYVAWTRPIYVLHAFITRPRSASTPLTRGLDVLISAFREQHDDSLCEWETVAWDAAEEESIDAGAPYAEADTIFAAQAPALSLPELPWRPMGWLPRLRIFRSPLESGGFNARQRGVLAHLCLEHLHITAAAGGASEDVLAKDVRRAVRQGIRLFPLLLDDPGRIAEEMEKALFWFATLPEAAFWLRHGKREQEIMDEEGRMHRVDLLVDEAAYLPETGHPGLLALDYKTGSGGENGPQEEYLRQIRRYMRLMSAASGRPTRGILIYLDERRLVTVQDVQGSMT